MTAHGKELDIFNKLTFLINQTKYGNKCILFPNPFFPCNKMARHHFPGYTFLSCPQ